MKLQSTITLLAKILTITVVILAVILASQLSPARAVEQFPDTAAVDVASPRLQATPTPEPLLFGEFDTSTNGFGFQNYGAAFPEGDLTIAEVQDMFGDQVCHRLDGTNCVPSPEAQFWIDNMNQYMAEGHCNGFTVMSRRLYEGQFAADEFSEAAESVFDIEQSAPIMRRIAQNWTQQDTAEIRDAEFWGTPQEVIDELQEITELVELKIYWDNTGHSMLAYGLQDMGDGIYHILVYDNNHPDRTDLYVEVDYDANSWRYSEGALNPSEASAVRAGDDNDWPPNLVFVPLSAYDKALTCPFCSPGGEATANTTNVNLTGAGDFLVRDDQGRYSGIWAGTVIDNIPDSQVRRFVGAPSTKAARVSLPMDEDITVQIGNTTLAEAEPGDLRIGSPGFSAAVDDLLLSQSCTEGVVFSHNTQTLSFAASSVQQPVFKLAVQGDAGADFLFIVAGAEFLPSQDLSLDIDQDNGLVLTSDTLDADNVTLIMVRLGATGESVFASDGLVIQSDGAVAVDYANWNGLAPLNIQIDADGDGVFDQTLALDNAFPQTPVTGVGSSAELITLLNEVAPYMDTTDKSAFIAALGPAPLDGDDYGRLFLELDELEVSDDDLADFLVSVDLPLNEIVEVIHEVRRDGDGQAALLDRLPFPAEDKATVQDELQRLEEVRKVLIDYDFQDPAPHKQVEALLPYIFDRGLDPAQIGNLLERLAANGTLSDREIAELLDELNLPPDMEIVIREDISMLNIDDTPADPEPLDPEAEAEAADASSTDAPAEPTIAPEPEPTPTVEAPPTSTPLPVPTPTSVPALAPTATPAPPPTATSAPVTTAGQLSFESFGSWRRGDQPYGTFAQSNTCVQSGDSAGQLDYDFSAATAADDFVIFTQYISAPGNPNMIQAWVNGDGSGHLFNIWVEDANGEVWSVPMGAVTHTGWQQMSGTIDPNAPWPGGRVYGPDNGAIDYPLRFLGLVVDRTDGPAIGTLCFDTVTFGTGDPPSTQPEASTPPVASDPCANIPAPTSSDVMVRFVNSSSSPVTVSWVDFDGNLNPTHTFAMDPGGFLDQGTYATHEWAILDSNNQRIDSFIAGDEQIQCARITLDGAQERVGEDGPDPAGGTAEISAPIALEYAGYRFVWSWTGYPMMSGVDNWYFDVKIFDNEFADFPYDVKVAEVDAVSTEGNQWVYEKRSDFQCGSYWAVQIAARNPDGSYAGPLSMESNRVPTGADCPPDTPPGGSDGGDDGNSGGSCGGDDCFEG